MTTSTVITTANDELATFELKAGEFQFNYRVSFTRVNNDVNGNPRYVFHFLSIDSQYKRAVEKAKKIGGKAYRGKSYGGGIAIQSYNLHDTARDIATLTCDEAWFDSQVEKYSKAKCWKGLVTVY